MESLKLTITDLPVRLPVWLPARVAAYPYMYQILATSFFGCFLLLFRSLFVKRRNPKGLPLPPGPKGYPVIGNLFDFPINHQWLVYDEWTKKYGKYFMTNWPLWIRENNWAF